MTKTKEPGGLNSDDVIAFLKDNPRFLKDHPEIFDFLQAPKQHSGKGIVDFQDYMVRRLREDRDGIIREAQEIVETSRANMNNLTRVHRAVLMLLEARSFEDFIHVVTMDCASLLDVDIASLVIETDGGPIPHINFTGVHVVAQGTVDVIMAERSVLLEENIIGLPEIYGGGSGLVKSQMLLRLYISQHVPPAILAFGSRDPEMFVEGQGTEQVSFLARVIERCFCSWLNLP